MIKTRLLVVPLACAFVSITLHAGSVPIRAKDGIAASQNEIASRIGADAIRDGLDEIGIQVELDNVEFAQYIDKMFKGAKPWELPIEQPTRFEMVISAKAAQSIGLTIAEPVLIQADEVIR